MDRRTPLRRAAFAAAVTLALGFGARMAGAAPVAAGIPECRDPWAQGSCATQAQCQAICDARAPGTVGVCVVQTYCCGCLRLRDA